MASLGAACPGMGTGTRGTALGSAFGHCRFRHGRPRPGRLRVRCGPSHPARRPCTNCGRGHHHPASGRPLCIRHGGRGLVLARGPRAAHRVLPGGAGGGARYDPHACHPPRRPAAGLYRVQASMRRRRDCSACGTACNQSASRGVPVKPSPGRPGRTRPRDGSHGRGWRWRDAIRGSRDDR